MAFRPASKSFGKFLLFRVCCGGAICQPVLFLYARQGPSHSPKAFPCFLTTAHSERGHRGHCSSLRGERDRDAAGRLLEHAGARDIAVPAPAAAKAGREEAREAPVTESQLEVWLSDQLSEEASCSYNESCSLNLRGNDQHEIRAQAGAQCCGVASPGGFAQPLAARVSGRTSPRS